MSAVMAVEMRLAGEACQCGVCGIEQEIERRVAERTRQLSFANSELEMFNYSLSHDLRAPLRCIEGFAALLLEEAYAEKASEVRRAHVKHILDAAHKAHDLVDAMLRLSKFRNTPLQVGLIDVQAVVSEVIEDLEMERPVLLDVTVGKMPQCLGDASLLRQVFVNLIGNAYKFSAKVRKPTVQVGFHGEPKGGYYFVRDNGVGFNMANLPSVFKLFERLPNAADFAGTGVGLAIAANIVKRHGGTIWAQGDVGRGAIFCFSTGGGRDGESLSGGLGWE